MVSNNRLITYYEVTELIFKTFDKFDELGNPDKGLGFFSVANAEQLKFDEKEFKKALDDRKKFIDQYKADYDAAFDEHGDTDAAHRAAMANLSEADDGVRQYIETTDRASISAEDFGEKQTAAFDSAKKSAKGFSTATKAMFANIGAELAIAFAFQAAMKAFQAADEKWGLTAATRIEKMEEEVNKFNEATSESADNIKTLKSLKDEYNELSKGVDSAGKNIALSATEYDRYNEIVNQIAEINPELIDGYTSEGNAIIILYKYKVESFLYI